MTAEQLFSLFPAIEFHQAETFVWAPQQRTVYYDPKRLSSKRGLLALLHEISHALLDHQTFELDIELLNMEVAAWTKARQLAAQHKIAIDEAHIEDCLETYRIWLYKRSRCPNCANTSLQQDVHSYRCFLCGSTWQVAQSRTTQPRRMQCITPV